jgi:hypothetical protein
MLDVRLLGDLHNRDIQSQLEKVRQIGKGASWFTFPSASFTDSSPSNFRRPPKEMRFVPYA